jgi:hypothetical protein
MLFLKEVIAPATRTPRASTCDWKESFGGNQHAIGSTHSGADDAWQSLLLGCVKRPLKLPNRLHFLASMSPSPTIPFCLLSLTLLPVCNHLPGAIFAGKASTNLPTPHAR